MIALLLSSAFLAGGTVCPVSVDTERWTELTRREDFVVVLRVSGDCHSDLEVKVIDRGDEVEVEVVEASGRDFDEQLSALRQRKPDELHSTLCSSLRLTTRRVSSVKQSELAEVLRELNELRISPILPAEIHLDGVHYELRISSIGNVATFRFSGPKDTDEELRPLHGWSRKLLELVGASCTRRR